MNNLFLKILDKHNEELMDSFKFNGKSLRVTEYYINSDAVYLKMLYSTFRDLFKLEKQDDISTDSPLEKELFEKSIILLFSFRTKWICLTDKIEEKLGIVYVQKFLKTQEFMWLNTLKTEGLITVDVMKYITIKKRTEAEKKVEVVNEIDLNT